MPCWVNLGLHTHLSLNPCPYPGGFVHPFSLCAPLSLLDLGAFLGLCQGWPCHLPPLRRSLCGTKHNHKVDASILRSPAPVSSPVDDLELKARALALGEGSRDKIISASS